MKAEETERVRERSEKDGEDEAADGGRKSEDILLA